MPIEHQQLIFGGGVNAVAPAHAIGESEVQSAVNVDFGLERGAAMVRRGYSIFGPATPHLQPVIKMYRHYTTDIGSSKLFFIQSGTIASHLCMGTATGGTMGLSVLETASGTGDKGAFGSFKNRILMGFSAGDKNRMHDGTNTTEWFKQSPATALTISVNTLTPLAVSTTYSCPEGTSTTTTGTGVFAVDASTLRCQINGTMLTTNLNINPIVSGTTTTTYTIGDYGISNLKIAFSDPKKVQRVSLDYAIGTTDFSTYWHTEMTQEDTYSSIPDYLMLLGNLRTAIGTSSTAYTPGDPLKKALNPIQQAQAGAVSNLTAAINSLSPWRVPKTSFEFVGQGSNPTGWTNIQAARVVVEASAQINVLVADWQITGAEEYSLTDPDQGYVWWETWGKLDSAGAIVSESAPGPISDNVKVQGVNVTLTATGSPTGASTLHDLTHRFFYRQGGYLNTAYLVGSSTLTSTSATFVDKLTDISVLAGGVTLEKNIYSKSTAPGNIIAISEPYMGRTFIAFENKLLWSAPNRPDVFPLDNYTYVSHSGDEVSALIVTPPGLIIVNRDSVYELTGSVFDGLEQDWVLTRTGSKCGAKSREACVNTPYGITLLDYDGLSMYVPGQGVSVPITWAMEKMADVFAGTGTTDPASLKGDRIPAFNKPYILNCSIAYANNRLYFACPTGSATLANTVFVLDFISKNIWWYNTNLGDTVGIHSLYWDMEDNRLLAGDSVGRILRIESGMQDNPASVRGIVWNVKSRAWTTPSDTVLENIQVEYVGEAGTLAAYFDGGTKTVLTTMTSTVKDYFTSPINGTIANNVVFEISGTSTGTKPTAVYGITFDAIVEPPRIKYWKTEDDIHEYDGEKYWDVQYCDIETWGTGTVTCVSFIDGAAVMTNTIVSAATGIKSRDIYPFAYPAETYGEIAHATYTTTATNQFFKHWKTRNEARNEPPRITSWKTDITSLDENICDAADVDINPLGTVTSIVYVDNVAVGTYSNTGVKRQSFTNALPNETYGRTIYATYSGAAFKHYNTWFHLRKEPDRWTNFVSDKQSGDEQYWKIFNCTVNCLSGTLTATVFLDGAALSTHTFTGSTNQSYAEALPVDSYGRTIWASYTSSNKFKHYNTWFDGEKEPPRVDTHQAGPFIYSSEQYLKTWVAVLNCNGTCTGVLYGNAINGGTRTIIATETFTGTNKQTYNIGLESVGAGSVSNYSDLFVVYSGSNFKHYETKFETEPHPFKKYSWSILYKKVGGASRLDQARFWTVDFESDYNSGLGTLTSTWFADGIAVATDTLTATSTGRNYFDMLPTPPGIRGYEYSQYIHSSSPFTIWRSTLDTMRTGVKGYSRMSVRGRPIDD